MLIDVCLFFPPTAKCCLYVAKCCLERFPFGCVINCSSTSFYSEMSAVQQTAWTTAVWAKKWLVNKWLVNLVLYGFFRVSNIYSENVFRGDWIQKAGCCDLRYLSALVLQAQSLYHRDSGSCKASRFCCAFQFKKVRNAGIHRPFCESWHKLVHPNAGRGYYQVSAQSY